GGVRLTRSSRPALRRRVPHGADANRLDLTGGRLQERGDRRQAFTNRLEHSVGDRRVEVVDVGTKVQKTLPIALALVEGAENAASKPREGHSISGEGVHLDVENFGGRRALCPRQRRSQGFLTDCMEISFERERRSVFYAQQQHFVVIGLRSSDILCGREEEGMP